MKKIGKIVTPVILLAFVLTTAVGSNRKAGNGKMPLKVPGNWVNEVWIPNSDSVNAVLRGKVVYKAYCLSCHQFDGGGVENLNPPLIKTSFVLGDKARFIQIILKGFDKRVEIDGEDYSNNMPPLNFLTDQQIADVLTYVRNDFGNKATMVKAAEVKTVRAKLAQ